MASVERKCKVDTLLFCEELVKLIPETILLHMFYRFVTH